MVLFTTCHLMPSIGMVHAPPNMAHCTSALASVPGHTAPRVGRHGCDHLRVCDTAVSDAEAVAVCMQVGFSIGSPSLVFMSCITHAVIAVVNIKHLVFTIK